MYSFDPIKKKKKEKSKKNDLDNYSKSGYDNDGDEDGDEDIDGDGDLEVIKSDYPGHYVSRKKDKNYNPYNRNKFKRNNNYRLRDDYGKSVSLSRSKSTKEKKYSVAEAFNLNEKNKR